MLLDAENLPWLVEKPNHHKVMFENSARTLVNEFLVQIGFDPTTVVVTVCDTLSIQGECSTIQLLNLEGATCRLICRPVDRVHRGVRFIVTFPADTQIALSVFKQTIAKFNLSKEDKPVPEKQEPALRNRRQKQKYVRPRPPF